MLFGLDCGARGFPLARRITSHLVQDQEVSEICSKHKSLVRLALLPAVQSLPLAPHRRRTCSSSALSRRPSPEPTQAAPAAPAQPSGDEPKVAGVDRRFDGVTLRAAFIGGGQYEKMYESIKDWEAATGAKVEIVYKGRRLRD
ncbi:MAG: hypothetical protein KatS3mg052_1414 [Candidatus Roseilinea sp.]|nr:MAG: hypothetical protein KatS3mg052_1414 [Candidatus Roseilinea sp.]